MDEKKARAIIIVRAAKSAAETDNWGLLEAGLTEVLKMPRADAILLAKAIQDNFDLVAELSERAKK